MLKFHPLVFQAEVATHFLGKAATHTEGALGRAAEGKIRSGARLGVGELLACNEATMPFREAGSQSHEEVGRIPFVSEGR